jgi:hypothetical protein
MPYEDLLKYFYDITICKVRTNWFESRQSSYFYDFSSGAQVYFISIREDDQQNQFGLGEYEFEIELFATGRKEKTFDRNDDPEIDLCLILCKIDGTQNNNLQCVAFVHDIEYFISISKKLSAGNYVLYATSFRAISNLVNEKNKYNDPNFYSYNLILHGECNFNLSQTILSANKVSDMFYSVAKKQNNFKYELNNTVRTMNITTNSTHSILVENLSPESAIKINLDLSQSKNLRSTRENDLIEDYLAPLSKQIVVYLTPNNYKKAFSIGYKLEFEMISDFSRIKSIQNPEVEVFFSGLHSVRR